MLQVSYAIGVAQPLSVHVDTYGTGTIPDKDILQLVLKNFDFRPGAILAASSLGMTIACRAVISAVQISGAIFPYVARFHNSEIQSCLFGGLCCMLCAYLWTSMSINVEVVAGQVSLLATWT